MQTTPNFSGKKQLSYAHRFNGARTWIGHRGGWLVSALQCLGCESGRLLGGTLTARGWQSCGWEAHSQHGFFIGMFSSGAGMNWRQGSVGPLDLNTSMSSLQGPWRSMSMRGTVLGGKIPFMAQLLISCNITSVALVEEVSKNVRLFFLSKIYKQRRWACFFFFNLIPQMVELIKLFSQLHSVIPHHRSLQSPSHLSLLLFISLLMTIFLFL